MSTDENTISTETPVEAPVAAPVTEATAERAPSRFPARPGTGRGPRSTNRRPRSGGRDDKGGDKKGRTDRAERKSEFEQKTISVRRVTRVMAGGRRFSFSVAIVAGDKKGRVGVGLGKAADTAAAIDKALRDAKKNMITIPLTDTMSIPFDVDGKHAASRVSIRPAKSRGLVAGASARIVLELGGVKDVTAKMLGRSRNKLNNARAAIDALEKLR